MNIVRSVVSIYLWKNKMDFILLHVSSKNVQLNSDSSILVGHDDGGERESMHTV